MSCNIYYILYHHLLYHFVLYIHHLESDIQTNIAHLSQSSFAIVNQAFHAH